MRLSGAGMTYLSSPEGNDGTAVEKSATRLAADIDALLAAGKSGVISEEAIQALLAAAVRLYAGRQEDGPPFLPFNEQDVTATEVLISAAAMLKAARLEVFELTMWKGFGTV